MKILFLTERMVRGFGVSVVVGEIVSQLGHLGTQAYVGCLERDGNFPGIDCKIVNADPGQLLTLVQQLNIEVVIAHTSPFFEVLPHLKNYVRCIAWEHGEPSPSFFSDRIFEDGETSRRKRQKTKAALVYENVDEVIAISEFIRNDIQWLKAQIIYNGCDHVSDLGKKVRQSFLDHRPLRVGTLMRLGAGESAYKGNELFIKIANYFKSKDSSISFEVMGRGKDLDAQAFRDAGIETHLNASDEQRAEFLRSLDVFVSCSLWEGFNLPLVEAQALGTVGLAFDVGAHPEVTPFLCKNLGDMCSRLEGYARNKELLYQHSMRAYTFVRSKYSWERAAVNLLKVLNEGNTGHPSLFTLSLKDISIYRKSINYFRRHGMRATLLKIVKYLARRTLPQN